MTQMTRSFVTVIKKQGLFATVIFSASGYQSVQAMSWLTWAQIMSHSLRHEVKFIHRH